MAEPKYTVNLFSRNLAGVSIAVGDVVIPSASDGERYVVSTEGERGTRGSEGIALTATSGTKSAPFEMQTTGTIDPAITGLPTADGKTLVRTSATGRLERIDVASPGDDVVGIAEADGRLHLLFGFISVFDGASMSPGGDLTGDTSTQTVVGWQTKPLDPETMGAPNDGDIPAWNEESQQWEATTASGADAVSIQGNPVTAGAPATTSDVYVWDGAALTLRQLSLDDLTAAFNVTMGGAQTVEVGTTVATPAFTASYTGGPATSATLTDTEGSSPKALTTPFTSVSSDGTFHKTTNNQTATFTITAHKGAVSDTSNVTIAWRPRVYHGAANTGTLNEAFIEALATSNLQATRAVSYTDNATSGKYLWYAAPSSYGTPTFTVGGFAGGFSLVASAVSVTNAQGVAQNYDLWRSDNASLGSTTVAVS